MPNNIPSRESYINQPDTNKLDTLYDMGVNADKRLQGLEKRKRFDSTLSVGGGVIGGFAAMIAKWTFWK